MVHTDHNQNIMVARDNVMSVLETLAIISAIAGGVSQVGGFGASLYAGSKAAEEAEKAQDWSEKVYADQMRQQTVQNRLQQEQMGMSKAAQYFNQQLARRNEARTDQATWKQSMQTAANKYADILNKSRSLRAANAAALQNR